MKLRLLRALCETQAPEPLRKRRLSAPPNFLEFAWLEGRDLQIPQSGPQEVPVELIEADED